MYNERIKFVWEENSLVLRFFKKVVSEMKKVSWPTFNELVRKTLIVIVVVGILVLFSYVVDLGITAGIRHFSK